MAGPDHRVKEYARPHSLETMLNELNSNLACSNKKFETDSSEKFSKIFLVGPHRSGSTVFMQWLAKTGLVAYPTNLLSRFYGAPLVGAKIQQLLTDAKYNFRNEILDFNSDIDFKSENGKTKGALAPNEFWYFWRRYLPFDDLDYMPADKLSKQGNLPGLSSELNELANIFEKPFLMKAMIINQNIPELAEHFDKSLFIWIRREPIYNIQSALEARKRQYGDIKKWYSFKIKEYSILKNLDPLESVAGQIASINRSVEEGLSMLPDQKKLIIDYENFCQNPQQYYKEITQRLVQQNGANPERVPHYTGESEFKSTNYWRLREYSQMQAERAYRNFLKNC